MGRNGAGSLKSHAGFVERGHGFNDQKIDAMPGPPSARMPICSAKAARASSRPVLPSGSRRTPSGPTEPATQASAACFSLRCSNGLAGQAHTGRIDLGHFVGQPVAGQADAVGAECIGFKNLRAGLQVLLVNGENQTGIGKIQLVVAAVDEDTASIEHGTHGAVGEQGAVGEDLGELGHSVVMLRHASAGAPEQWPALLYFGSHKAGQQQVRGRLIQRALGEL